MRTTSMGSNLIRAAVLDKTGLPTIKRVLDLASMRQKITAGNMANVSTPKYQRRTVDFDAELKRLVKPDRLQGVRTNPGHISIGHRKDGPFKIQTDSRPATNGVNNVDVESEMAALAETQIWYQLGTTLAQKKFNGLRLAIKGQR